MLLAAWAGSAQTVRALVRELHTLGERATVAPTEEVLAAIEALFASGTDLDAFDRAALTYASRLTLLPRSVTREHLAPLRAAGLSEQEIVEVNQVACMFNFMNRLADGTGIVLGEKLYDLARDLFGDEALAAHLSWAAATPETS